MDSLFQENISNFRFIAFDTETTGSVPGKDHVVEIAALTFDEDFEHRRFEALIKPPISMPKDVINVHGITDEMVENAPDACSVLDDFLNFLNFSGHPRVLLAHNAGFDVSMLHFEWSRIRKKGLNNNLLSEPIINPAAEIVLDSCSLAKNLLPDLKRHSLQALANHFSIPDFKAHRAMEDIKALYKIFLNLLGLAADKISNQSQELTLGALVDLCGGYFVLDPFNPETQKRPFILPPNIQKLESLCGSNCKVAITYSSETEEYRYITPIRVRIKGYRIYIEAFCHRDQIQKTFRADRVIKVGEVQFD